MEVHTQFADSDSTLQRVRHRHSVHDSESRCPHREFCLAQSHSHLPSEPAAAFPEHTVNRQKRKRLAESARDLQRMTLTDKHERLFRLCPEDAALPADKILQ